MRRRGGRERVAVELSAQSARLLVEKILAALASGELEHGKVAHAKFAHAETDRHVSCERLPAE